jgi:succinate dehydrogenase / fumarate reductase cytochrome b subunit
MQWGELDPHRRENAKIGMWAWLWQRISALAIVVLLALHITLTYKLFVQFLLLLVVAFHAALGLRVILLDFNLVDVKYQRALVWGLMTLGVVVVATIWFSIH